MSAIHSSQLAFFASHAPFDRMERAHLLWMLEHMQLAYYARDEVIASPGQGQAARFYVIQQGVVSGGRDAGAHQEALLELHEGECFPLGALLARRPVASVYHAAQDVFCFELGAQDFYALLDLSPAFKDFCTRRIAALLEQSSQAVQTRFLHASIEQQSLSSTLASVIRREPVSCAPGTTIGAALAQMRDAHLGSMVVVDAKRRPLGIFTLPDLLERVVLAGLSVDQPIGTVMTREPLSLPPEAPAYEAAVAMAQKGVRHVLVTAGDGTLRGILSERDLFSLQRVGLRQISSAIRQANDNAVLAGLSEDIRQLTHNMMAQGVAAEQLTHLISTLNDLLAARIVELEFRAAGLLQSGPEQSGPERSGLCWLALGSEGRQEQTFHTDQDNGLIFAAPAGETADSMRARLLPVARRINQALAACGFPLCDGGIMAGNPEWCLSTEEWRHLFAEWIEYGGPDDLLNASIFFDFRPLYGDTGLADALRVWLNDEITGMPRFLHQMAANALRNRPPLGVLRDFMVGQQNTLDIKLNGTTPFVDAVRIFSLASGCNATNTVRRLREIAQPLRINVAEIEGWVDAFQFLQTLRLRHQYECGAQGRETDNRINPEHLNELDRRILKEAFRQVRKMQNRLAIDYRL